MIPMRVIKFIGTILICFMAVAAVVLFFMRADATRASDKAALIAAAATQPPEQT